MKKFVVLLLALVMCLSLYACGGNEIAENPYEKYAKYEDLFIYLEAGDWENANTYIQNYFGMRDDDHVNNGTTPPETTVPEPTVTEPTVTEPEPVYETIEITMDNWQDYFEFRTRKELTYNAFDELEQVILFHYLIVKDGVIADCTQSNISVEIEFTQTVYDEFTFDKQTNELSFSEIVRIDTHTSIRNMEDCSYDFGSSYPLLGAYYLANNLFTNVPGRGGRVLTNSAILRIQGTITIQTN